MELTGGAWYTDDKLDVEFIDQLSSQLLKFITAKSSPPHSETIYQSSFKSYPNLTELHNWLTKSGITPVALSIVDVASLIDVLHYDGSIQKIQIYDNEESDYDDCQEPFDQYVYKSIRNPRDSGNALTDVPCGVCTVFSFCKSGGPVSPEKCLYFTQWLNW